MAQTTEQPLREEPTGLEDVIRSVRALARTTRNLGESGADVLERELEMAIRISENIRERVISDEAIEEARKEALPAKLRRDAHRLVDLAADAASVTYVQLLGFLEEFTDTRRPDLRVPAADSTPAAGATVTKKAKRE